MARNFASILNDKITITDDASLQFSATDDYSICLKVKHDSLSNLQMYYARQDATSNNVLQVRKTAANKIELVAASAADRVNFVSSASVTNDTWYFIGITRKGSATKTLRMYIAQMGATLTEDSNMTDASTNGHGTVAADSKIGIFYNDTNGSLASIADITLWKGAIISVPEFQTIVNGVSPSRIRPTEQVLCMPLYGNTSPEADLSGNGNNGVVVGATKADHAAVGRYVPAPRYTQPGILAAGLSAISNTLTKIFNVREQVSSTSTHRFGILSEISQTITKLFNIRQTVANTSTHLFDILSALTAVSNTLTKIFDVRQEVSQTSTHRFGVISDIVLPVKKYAVWLSGKTADLFLSRKNHNINLK